MAKLVSTTLVDDIDGSEAAETLEFGIDGRAFEIDLSVQHAAELRDAVAEFVASGRRVGPAPAMARKPRQHSGTAPAVADREQTRAKRDWARQNGFKVSDRGRIPAEVEQAYNTRSTPDSKDLAAGYVRPVADEKVEADTTAPAETERKLAVVPSPFETEPTDETVLAWWTGVLKKPEPKSGKVTDPMRRQYAEQAQGA